MRADLASSNKAIISLLSKLHLPEEQESDELPACIMVLLRAIMEVCETARCVSTKSAAHITLSTTEPATQGRGDEKRHDALPQVAHQKVPAGCGDGG